MIPYSPLAGGFLTGKYRRNNVPESARAGGIRERYLNERGFAIVDALDAVAQAHGVSLAAAALAWLLNQPVITAPIIGANNPEQLHDSLQASGLHLSVEQMASLNDVGAWDAQGP